MPPNIKRAEAYEFGPFRLDLVVRQLFHKGKPLPLSSYTFDILTILAENSGQVVTKEELISQVWPERFVEENNLSVRISTLRKVLGASVRDRYIETVPGYGYRFVARVNEIFNENGGWREESLDSLAVLPLINENNLQRLDYLCDGITENLITSLSHLPNLRVMARSTVFRYKGGDVDPKKVGKELGVRAVLVGIVGQVANSLKFEMEMIDVRDGAYLWGAKYNRQVSDLFKLQEELVREITENLRIKLSKVEEGQVTKRYTDNTQAHHLYLKGRYFWNKRSIHGITKAIKYYRNAIRFDPCYALALAGVADAYFLLGGYGLRPLPEMMLKARMAALKAIEIDERLAEAHVSLGNIRSTFDWDWSGAEREFRIAIELNPNYAPAHQYYANFLVKFCRFDEAIDEVKKAYEIDLLSLPINLLIGKIYYFARRYDDAVKKGREILEIEPRFGIANGLIGMAYLEMNRYQDAIKEFRAMIGFSSGNYKVTRGGARGTIEKLTLPDADPESIAFLGYAYALAGKRNRALQILDELGKLIKKRYVQPHTLALVYIGLGEKDKAFKWLERALIDKTPSMTYIKVLPFFDSLRSDPRYEQLVRRLGLPL